MALLTSHIVMLFYGALAFGAMGALWHNRIMRPLGYALVAAWVMSNMIHLGLAFEWRPILYPIIDLMIALVARRIWHKTGSHITVVAIVLSLINCTANVSYAISALKLVGQLPETMHSSHTLITNIIFGVKCISLIAWGLADAYGWFGRIDHLPSSDRRDIESYPRHETRAK